MDLQLLHAKLNIKLSDIQVELLLIDVDEIGTDLAALFLLRVTLVDTEEKMIIFKKSKTMLPGHSFTPTEEAPSQNTATKKWFWMSIYNAWDMPFFQWWVLQLDSNDRQNILCVPSMPHSSSDSLTSLVTFLNR